MTLGLMFIMLPYRTWKSGLNGERKTVKNISDKLGSNYSLFNNVLLKDQKRVDIDHIVVGPTGIFVIETKNNEGIVTFDGDKWGGIRGNPCGQAVSNAIRIKDILKNCEVFKEEDPYVNAAVLFTNSKINLKAPKDPKQCKVLQIKTLTDTNLSDYVRNRPICFSNEEIASIEQSLKINIGNYED